MLRIQVQTSNENLPCASVNPWLKMYVCVCVSVCVCMHACMYVCMHAPLILDSSVSVSVGIKSVGDSVPKTLVQILHSAEEDNLSPFDLKIACLCQSIEINNKHVWCVHVCMHACMYACMYVWMCVCSNKVIYYFVGNAEIKRINHSINWRIYASPGHVLKHIS